MPAEPVTSTERSLIPREILTILAALCFACSIAGVIIAAVGWERGTLKNQIFARDGRYTQDYSRFVISVGPFIPFIMILAGAWNAKRIALFALAIFVAWAGMAIDLSRVTDNDRTEDIFEGEDTKDGGKMLEAGLIIMLGFGLLSLLAISPRDTTRWWRRDSRQIGAHPTTHAVTTPGVTTAPRRRRGPLFIMHYILTTLGFLVTLTGCSVLLENIRRNYREFPIGSEAIQVLHYLYFILITIAFFAVATALLCDSDLYAGFSLALHGLTIILALRFAVDIDNFDFDSSNMRRMLEAGLSLLFVGSVISAAGVMSRRSNVNVDDVATSNNPALP